MSYQGYALKLVASLTNATRCSVRDTGRLLAFGAQVCAWTVFELFSKRKSKRSRPHGLIFPKHSQLRSLSNYHFPATLSLHDLLYIGNAISQQRQVWRSVQDWDPQSREMLASYLHVAKGVVEEKQVRPGVAVHVRLGGNNRSSGVDKDDNTDIANSYPVWAISSGRETCGLTRVGCSDLAQTDIPRSSIQRVQVMQILPPSASRTAPPSVVWVHCR